MVFGLSSPPSSPLLTPNPSSDHVDSTLLSSPPLPKAETENVPPADLVQKSHQSTLRGFFTLPPKLRPNKRPLSQITDDYHSDSHAPIMLKSVKREPNCKLKDGLTQLHLTHLPLLHTCRECLMSYVRGGEDEGLHERHHARVTRGIIWDGLGRSSRSTKMKGKEKDKEVGWRVVKDNVSFGPKGKGRIIVADGSCGGAKVSPG